MIPNNNSIPGFLVFSSLTTFHFFCAMCDGPGYLPLEWKPVRKTKIFTLHSTLHIYFVRLCF